MSVKYMNILVPTDFSDCADQAVEAATELAVKFGGKVSLLHVLQDIVASFPEPGVAYPIPGNYLQELQAGAEQSLKTRMSQIPDSAAGEIEIRHGSPFVEIVRFAKERQFDLIVLGTHGRSGLAHVLMGSVSEKVVRKAPCPVLTVRPPAHEFKMP